MVFTILNISVLDLLPSDLLKQSKTETPPFLVSIPGLADSGVYAEILWLIQASGRELDHTTVV